MKRRVGISLGYVVATVFLFALLLILCVAIANRIHEVPFKFDESIMEPTIKKGATIVFVRGNSGLGIGDVVAYDTPHVSGGKLIARVAGLSDDVVSYSKDWLIVNGVPYRNDRIFDLRNYPEPGVGMADSGVHEIHTDTDLVVKNNHVFLVADRWEGVVDSRSFGTVPRSAIIGIAKSIK